TNLDNDLLNSKGQFIYGLNDSEYINLNEHNLKAWIYGHWHDNFVKKHGKDEILTVCSSSPDKAGIIHSMSSFRVFTIDKEGKLSIETRSTYMNHHAVVASPARKQIVTESGEVPISVNAYHTASP